MSYYFEMRFRECESKADAFNIALQATEAAWKHFGEIMEHNLYYIPSVRFPNASEEVDRYWVESLAKLRFVWWEEHKLLSLVGGAWPEEVQALFPKLVEFQNSTNQDYEFSEWEGICPKVQELANLCRNGAVDDILAALPENSRITKEDLEGDTEETEEETAYYRRWAAYELVYKELALNDWLWGADSPSFERFTLSAITTQERAWDAHLFVKRTVRKARAGV